MLNSTRSLIRAVGVTLILAGLAEPVSMNAQAASDLWFRRTVPGLTADLHSVAFGNGQFVAVGADSTVVRSGDGVHWTSSTTGTAGSLTRVRFLNGAFVAMGPAHQLLFSTDGLSWEARSFPGAVATDVAYGNGVYVSATDVDPYYSTDGLQWTPIAERDPNAFPWVTPNSAELRTVTFSAGRFVGIRAYHPKVFSGSMEYVSSVNGLDWTLGPADYIPLDGGAGTIDQGLGLFAFAPQVPGVVGLHLSTDGTAWNCVGCSPTPMPTGYEVGAAFGAQSGVRVTVLYGFAGIEPRIFSTVNGVDWTPSLQFPTPFEDPNLAYYAPLRGFARGVAAGAGGFAVVGDGGYILHSGPGSGAPTIVSQPVGLSVAVGQAAAFKVVVSGAPPISYQWYHGEQPIDGATEATFTLSSVQTTDAGSYKVVASNGAGSVTSQPALLEVAFLHIKMYAGVQLDGTVGKTYRIEATEVGTAPNWQPVAEVVLPSSHYVWFDTGSPDHATRLYRATELP